ncbi:MAG: phage tail tape measure protein [Planctomycetes bacterium]|nr:phage tail tape measure protein [Planctomycetota bacterium]MCW8136409.1 phage tail tape measure protein [Planctomycetota bacterium]
MALENYTRGQKIFMVGLVVLLAAMFTVTGAMITLFGQSGEAAPADHGRIDDREIRLMEWHRKRRGLGIVRMLDSRASQAFGDKRPEVMYARVPAMAPRPEFGHDWPYIGVKPTTVSLLELWPNYQDQDLWCHVVLVERAREAGVQEPSNVYVGALLTALMNEGSSDLEKFEGKDLRKKFEEIFGAPLDDLIGVFREAVMVRDYVNALLADHSARLDAIARMSQGKESEFNAEYMRLTLEPFMEQARRDVQRRNRAFAASRLAVGGAGTLPFGADTVEEVYDKNRNTQLQSKASFELDIIRAFPADMVSRGEVIIDAGLAKLIYQAVRDEVYKATEDDKKNIEQRLKAAEDTHARRNAEETREWTEERWKQWREGQRPSLLEYRSYDEVEIELLDSLRQRESLRSAQGAVLLLLRALEDRKKERERGLNAQLDVIRKEKRIWDDKKSYLESLRQRFDSVETQLHASLRNIDNRIRTQAESSDEAAVRRALEQIATDFGRALSDFDTSQLQGLISTAGVATQSLERSINDKEAEREEFVLQEKKENADGSTMSEEEVQAKLKGFDHEIMALRERLRLRDELLPKVEAFVEEIRALLSAYELQARAAAEGDNDLRRFVLRELLVEIPAVLGKRTRATRDEIAPQAQVDEFAGFAELIDADIQARNNSLRKDAADASNFDINAWVRENSGKTRLGLEVLSPTGTRTWETLIEDDRYAWMENVEGAQRFLEDAQNAKGATSGVLALPGKGYLILRLRAKTPKYPQGRLDADERLLKLSAMMRARQLCVDALRDLRRVVIDKGWDAAVEQARQKYGSAFSVRETGWFKEGEDIPNLYSHNDSDVLNYNTSPSPSAPDSPFITRLKDIRPKEGVSEIIPEKFNPDLLRRPEFEEWSYLLARVKDRRPLQGRIAVDDMQDKGQYWAPAPGEIWRERHLAASELVRGLVEPATLLKDRDIIQYKAKEKKKENSESAAP